MYFSEGVGPTADTHVGKFIPVQLGLLQNINKQKKCLASYHMLRFNLAIPQSFSSFYARFIKTIDVDK